jgi:hypothetical protein
MYCDSFEVRTEESRPPLWSSGQSSWLRIQRSGFYSRHNQIFRELVGLERGPLSLLSTTEELLERSSGSGLENVDYNLKDPSRWQRGTTYLQKLAVTWPTSGGRSVGIVRSRTQATEFGFSYYVYSCFVSTLPPSRRTSVTQEFSVSCLTLKAVTFRTDILSPREMLLSWVNVHLWRWRQFNWCYTTRCYI